MRAVIRRTAASVASSAGKNSSSASSDNATSMGLPNTVVRLRNERISSPVFMRNGTEISRSMRDVCGGGCDPPG